MDQKPILFFDGECGLCNGVVAFLIKNDLQSRIQFESLQSKVAREKLISPLTSDSVVLLMDGKLIFESSAVIEVLRLLPRYTLIAKGLSFIPRSVRDPVYRYIAKNRKRWFK